MAVLIDANIGIRAAELLRAVQRQFRDIRAGQRALLPSAGLDVPGDLGGRAGTQQARALDKLTPGNLHEGGRRKFNI